MAIVTLVGAIIGALVYLAIPASYSATASVSVNPISTDPAETSRARTVNIPTERKVLASPLVGAAVRDELKPEFTVSTNRLIDSVHTSSPEDSLVIEATYKASDAKLAAAAANAFAHQYLEIRHDQASAAVAARTKAAADEIDRLKAQASNGSPSDLTKRSIETRVDELSKRLADLSNVDLNPGAVVDDATVPTSRSTPAIGWLIAAGALLGLLAGILLALRRDKLDPAIRRAEALTAMGLSPVLDGTNDPDAGDTWDIAAVMLKVPNDIGFELPFTIMVDATIAKGGYSTGTDLVAALERRGQIARYVDASAINDGKISRGWPSDRKLRSWGGEVVIIDTTKIPSAAHRAAVAARCNSVVIARQSGANALAVKRFVSLLRSESIDIALTVLTSASGSDSEAAARAKYAEGLSNSNRDLQPLDAE
ncbi:hypothetical protein BH09ACT10_BH09ACT10_19830 [soil metagenome]